MSNSSSVLTIHGPLGCLPYAIQESIAFCLVKQFVYFTQITQSLWVEQRQSDTDSEFKINEFNRNQTKKMGTWPHLALIILDVSFRHLDLQPLAFRSVNLSILSPLFSSQRNTWHLNRPVTDIIITLQFCSLYVFISFFCCNLFFLLYRRCQFWLM